MTFAEWFNEIELYSLRGERFYDDLYTYKMDGIDAEHIINWLKAAYEVGYEHAMGNLLDDGK